MAAVALAGLVKRFGDAAAVDGVDLAIGHGELVCLLGPSGCGKTTTLRLVAGFVAPDAGTIRVGERIVSSSGFALPPERRGMSMIFQSYALWPHMTVEENVAYGLTLRRLPRDEIGRRVDAMLRTARIEALAARYPGELSGGQQQRVALARALVVEPETLLLDEPLSNLDANLREEMRFELRRLHDETRYTTIYVTHDQVEAMTAADRIVVMHRGRVEQEGTPEEVYRRPRSEFVARFIGGANVLRGRRLDARHVELQGLRLRCADGEFGAASGGEAAIAIRFHDARLLAAAPPDGTENAAPVDVRRRVFLGASRDYLVELRGGTQLRVTAPPELEIAPGDRAWIQLPPERCRALDR